VLLPVEFSHEHDSSEPSLQSSTPLHLLERLIHLLSTEHFICASLQITGTDKVRIDNI